MLVLNPRRCQLYYAGSCNIDKRNAYCCIRHMIIEPKVRGFICITAHPTGCSAHVQQQADFVRSQPKLINAPKRVLIIGASTGYGLASRIVSVVGAHASTFGVFFERPADGDRTASAGWYNTVALEQIADKENIPFYSMNGDAFSAEFKQKALEAIKRTLGTVDCVIYSLAAPRRTDKEGNTYKSVLKPIGKQFTGKTVNTDNGKVYDVSIDPATEDELKATVKVMGGEDWSDWMHALADAHLLAPKVTALAYSYIGPEVTWPIYKSGTIGQAKAHLMKTAQELNEFLGKELQGRALISVNKAVVTQASSAIPVVPLYNSILFKIMKSKNLHEDCIQQMYRLFAGLFDQKPLQVDNATCVRLDDWELNEAVQAEVRNVWSQISTENLKDLSDFEGYQKSFLQLFGFECDGVDYGKDVPINCLMNHLMS